MHSGSPLFGAITPAQRCPERWRGTPLLVAASSYLDARRLAQEQLGLQAGCWEYVHHESRLYGLSYAGGTLVVAPNGWRAERFRRIVSTAQSRGLMILHVDEQRYEGGPAFKTEIKGEWVDGQHKV